MMLRDVMMGQLRLGGLDYEIIDESFTIVD